MIPLHLVPGPMSSFGVRAEPQDYLGVPMEFQQGIQALSRVETCKSAVLLSWKSSVIFPVGLTIGIGGFLSRHHRAVTTAIVF